MTETVKNPTTSTTSVAAKPTSKPTTSTRDSGKVRIGGGLMAF